MDAELKQYLDGMTSHLEVHLETRLNVGFQDFEARIMQRVDGRLDTVEERMRDFTREALETLETRILSEFWKWGGTSDMRTKQALADTSVLNERLIAVEDRISALERKRA